MRIADLMAGFKRSLLILTIALMVCLCCGERKEQGAVKQERDATDYAGQVSEMLQATNLSPADSLILLQRVYQMTACDQQFFELQDELLSSYFTGCNEKCEKGQCSASVIAIAAMASALENDFERALNLCGMIGDSGRKSSQVDDIVRLTLLASRTDSASVLMAMKDRGEIKTPLGLAYLVILTIGKGMAPAAWVAALDKEKQKSNSVDILYAHAYAIAAGGDYRAGFLTMPQYAPLAKAFPQPSFVEQVKIGDSTYTERIFPPLALYVRKELDRGLLNSLLDKDYSQDIAIDVAAIGSLAYVKGIAVEWKPPQVGETLGESGMDDPRKELIHAILLCKSSNDKWGVEFESLRLPVSRAAYLMYSATTERAKDDTTLAHLVFAEVDSVRKGTIWEARVLLSEAMFKAAGPLETFRRIGNLGVSDLSVRNNSPEWLALYARAGLLEGSELGLVSQLIFNLSQHYPYTVGLYEMMQSYNHICKYY